jgi:dephospho-CoA kinase
MQEVGWAVMSSGRQAELNAQLVLRVNRMRNTVIDGLRHPVDFDYLSQFFGRAFRLIFVRADRSVRLQRSLSGLGSVAAFEKSEQQPVESFIDELLPFSFAAVSNNGPLEHLHSELRDVLERLFAEALT